MTNDVPGSTQRFADRRARRADGALAPQLFLVLDAARPYAPAARHSLADVDVVSLGRGAPRAARKTRDGKRVLALTLPDRGMSLAHAQLVRLAAGGWNLVDVASTNGTLLNGAPVARARLADGDVFELGHTFFRYRASVPVTREAPADTSAADLDALPPGLATLLPPLSRDFDALTRVARSDVAVVVSGETGTGKELVARAVHTLSGRAGPFVAMNCGALAQQLIEAELFGYRRGAFSGATEDRPGLVRAADGGTLFLDEIGDLPRATQATLLRVLQEREVLPVGATTAVKVDVRVVAATHRDLDAMVAAGEFRQDLQARLGGFTLRLPPLRQRREDLGLLVATLLGRVAPEQRAPGQHALALDLAVARALLTYQWPSNVRELERCLGAAVALARDGIIEASHLPVAIMRSRMPTAPVAPAPAPDEGDEDEEDADARLEEQLLALLRKHGGNVSAVARAMGKARLQIQRWLKRYRIDPARFRATR